MMLSIQCITFFALLCRGDDIDARENILSKRLLEAGCECCDSSATLRELLADVVKDIHEKDVAIALGCMARAYADIHGTTTTTSGESNWNVENFVAVIVDLVCKDEPPSPHPRTQPQNH